MATRRQSQWEFGAYRKGVPWSDIDKPLSAQTKSGAMEAAIAGDKAPAAEAESAPTGRYDYRWDNSIDTPAVHDRRLAQFKSRGASLGSAGGSGRTTLPTPTTTTQTTTTKFAGKMPEVPNAPQFNMPEYDEGEVRKLTQKHAAPGRRALRRQVQTALMRSYENPNVRRMILRDTLQGYGQGLENVMAGAHRQAASEYGTRRAEEYQERMANWQAQVNRINQMYQAAMQKYMSSATQTTTKRQTYTTGDGDKRRYVPGTALAEHRARTSG